MAQWCQVAPEHAQDEHVVTWLAEGGNWSATTRHTYHCALQAWFLWLQVQGHRTDNPMIRVGKPRRPRSKPRPISDQELRRMLRTRMNQRTRTMVVLAAFAGLRVHEIAKIRGEHVDLVGRQMTIVGKGGHKDVLPLSHFIIEQAYRMPREGFWFPGADEGHQHRESVGDAIKQVMVRAGVVGSAHCLRHWYGSALLERGVDVRVVQELMRHASLTSTQIYTEVKDHRRVEGIERLDPFDNIADLSARRPA